MTVRTKVFLLFAGAALLTVVPVLFLISQAVKERVYARATEALRDAAKSVEYNRTESFFRLQETARRIAGTREVERLMRSSDPEALGRVLERQVEKGQVVVAVDSAGRSLVGPELDSAVVNSGGTTVVVPLDGAPPIRVAVWPVYVPGGSVDDLGGADPPSLDAVAPDSIRIGVIGVGERLDRAAMEALKTATGGADIALIAGDSVEVVASTLPDSLTAFLAGQEIEAWLQRAQFVNLRSPERLLFAVNPLRTAGRPAALVLFRGVQEELQLSRGIEQSVIGIGVAALVVALMLALLVARIVARPAQALAAAATDLARGNFGTPLPHPSGDEIGQLTHAFGEMRAAIAERESRLRSAQAELIHREKLAAMGRLVAQLSHEINNPIYNIQNCLEVLDRRSDPNDPNREFLSLAREELQRMATLTRQMLDQSRPLADAARPLDLNQTVQRVIQLAGAELGQNGVRCDLRLQPDLPPVVAHPDALQQVLANLVDNAAYAMPEGGLLTVSTRADEEAVEVSIADTGVGITPEDLPHIFDAFYTTKPEVSGIGLGLFVSEGIIRGHRGRLLVDSTPGEGSRFTVRLPRQTLDAALATESGRAAEPASA